MKRLSFILALLCLSVLTLLPQAVDLEVPDNMVAENVPKVPLSLVESVRAYTDFRAAVLNSWHPARREILISTRFGDTPQVHQVKFPGGARRQLTFYPDRVGAGIYSPAGGNSFAFSKDRGGSEFFQLYRYDLSNNRVTLLTDGKSRNTDLVWSNAGDRFAYGSTRRNGKDVDLYVVRPSDPKTDRMLAQLEGGGWTVSDWSSDDSKLLVAEFVSINESYLWLMDANSGEKMLLTPKGASEKIFYGSARFGKDGRGIYVTTDRDSEFRRLTYVDLSSRQHRFLTEHISWDVDEFDLSSDGKWLAFVANEDGIGRLHLLGTETGKERSLPQLPVGVIGGVKWHRNSRDLGFNLVSARSPADVYSLDVQTGKTERWTESETGGVAAQNFSEPELIHWKSFDGRSLSGFLYKPPASFSGARPVVLDIHGGPESQARPGFLGRSNYFLNELGVAILYPNVRGSSGYGKTFLKLDNGFQREDSYKDIGSLLDWIKTRGDLDANRVMVTGGSYGGHMTFAVATRYGDRIRAALPVVGISSLVTFLKRTESYRRDLRRAEYGDERDSKMREFLESIAPLNNAAKITKPLFIVQGGNDPRVPASEAEQMVATVRKQGVPVWFLMAKDEGHGFAKKKNADFQFYTTILFMKQYFLN